MVKNDFKIKRDIMKMQSGNYDNMKEDNLIQRFSRYANKFMFMNSDPYVKKKY